MEAVVWLLLFVFVVSIMVVMTSSAETAKKEREASLQAALLRSQVNEIERTVRRVTKEHLHELEQRFASGGSGSPGTAGGTSSAWERARNRFWSKEIVTALRSDDLAVIKSHALKPAIFEVIDQLVSESAVRSDATMAMEPYRDTMSPLEYERWCARRLKSAGWRCELTKASGDQGADIIARFGESVLVLQCKKYSRPVGNAAVQEVVAARGHHKGTHAAVVSNAQFTKAAQELASSNKVILLHHSQLAGIRARI